MKKFLLALTTAVAFSGSAFAADMAARMPMKAVAPVPVANWTGFYIFGGAGGGLWDADTFTSVTATGAPLTINQRVGGDGWYGTVGAGYDWQVNPSWVFGVFGDGQFGSLRGTINDPTQNWSGTIKMQDAWAAGVRVGLLIAPNVLSYVNGGYSGSHWTGTGLVNLAGFGVGEHTNSFNRNGWFFGGGVENNLNIFGISAPGWFMKTEYRGAYYGNKGINELVDGTNAFAGRDINFRPWVQTISTSLVYRFNWTGPVVAKY
jgi:outer membrane immunogenic protein